MTPAAPLFALFLAFAGGVASAPSPYRLEPGHTAITFSYRQLGILSSAGRISHAEGEGVFDPGTPDNSTIAVEIDMSSLTVGNTLFDAALRGPDYFDVAHFPVATFRSTRVTSTGAASATVDGLLTLHGVARPVRLTASYRECAPPRQGLDMSVSGKVRRSDFGIGRNAFLVGDEIILRINAHAEAEAL